MLYIYAAYYKSVLVILLLYFSHVRGCIKYMFMNSYKNIIIFFNLFYFWTVCVVLSTYLFRYIWSFYYYSIFRHFCFQKLTNEKNYYKCSLSIFLFHLHHAVLKLVFNSLQDKSSKYKYYIIFHMCTTS